MKKQKIDKTHWIIQFSTLVFLFVVFLFIPKILDLKYVFPREKGNKPFTKSWIFNDFTYWNIFALLLSLIAILHFLKNNFVYGVFTQIFGYVALFLGYANELRNEIMRKKVKKRK